MNVLILAAGVQNEARSEERFPTWLAEIEGGLMLERQVSSFRPLQPSRFIFVFREEEMDKYVLREIVEQIAPGSVVISVRHETAGAACTALLASGVVDMKGELVVASATDHLEVDLSNLVAVFREKGGDAGVFCFQALHPRYSYVLLDDDGWVIESAEKRPISRNASAGVYWFKVAADFFNGAKRMIYKDAHVQGSFYICPILNELILDQKRIAAHQLMLDQYHPIKSSRQVERLERDVEDHLSG